MSKNKYAHLIIFITIFIDLLGFGIIIPLLPDFSDRVLHINKTTIGFLVGIFSLMQFIFTPVWGSFSDIYGRKPILIMSLAGNAISYFITTLVFSGIFVSLPLLIISRAFAGLFSANLSAAQAVISDITTKENRSKGMGILGGAFGLGFVFGPAMGGVLSKEFGYGVPMMLSGVFSLIALLLCIFIFRETLPEEIRLQNKHNFSGVRLVNFRAIHDVITNRAVGIFVIIFFFITFSYANIYGTFQLFAERKDGLALDQEQVGFLLSFLGIISSGVQFFLIKHFKNIIGEEKSVILGSIFVCFGLTLLPFSLNIPVLLLFMFILAFGNGINIPMVMGLISQNVSREEQGSVLGINQALGSLARFLGPLWGGFIYDRIGYQFPFLTGGFFMLIITLISMKYIYRKPAKNYNHKS